MQELASAVAPALEMAHVLFMDIVAYSKLPMEQACDVLSKLQDSVRNTATFARAQRKDRLICLPTGDGMALVFFGDPESPVCCARELTQALRQHPEIKLRMGIHTGPVYRVADINANRNVAGGGINMAQRVMDCGDAGHILVSNAVAEVLVQLSTWSPFLRDLGEVEVKHGVRVHIYNLHTGEAGNPELPQKLRTVAAQPQQEAVPIAASPIKPGQIDRGQIKPGQTIGDYEAQGQLGPGINGEVYKVRHIISHRTEVLKLLRPERMGGEHSDRFLKETRVLASLSHSHIARFLTAFKADDRIAMVMEFIEGQDLEAKLRTHWPERVAEGTEYVLQVLSALEYAHIRGVIHRDIKPPNIMITPQGQAKILDFGMPFEAADPSIIGPESTVSSLCYMSPEQLRGERADSRSDLYSTSVVLYEIVTGRRPFDGTTKHEIITGHLREQPKWPGDIDPGIPSALSAILMKALAKQPAERFQNATDFLDALTRVSLDEAVTLQSLSIQPRARTSPSDAARAPSGSPVGKPRLTTPPPGRSTPKPSRSTLDPSVLDSVSNELAAFIGPIAKMVVKRAADRCSSVDDLYAAVAAEIASAKDRSSFLSTKKRHV